MQSKRYSCTNAAVRLPALIKAAEANGAEFLVLDTAPNADQTASLAARAADPSFTVRINNSLESL